MQSDQTAIIVSGLPQGISKDDIMIYFQKESKGGGEVRQVIFPLKSPDASEALVIFDDVHTVHKAVAKRHTFNIKGLEHDIDVKAVFEVFESVAAVLTKDIVNTLKSVTKDWQEFLRLLEENSCLKQVVERDDGYILLKGSWFQVQNARMLVIQHFERLRDHSANDRGGDVTIDRDKVVGAERKLRNRQSEIRNDLAPIHKKPKSFGNEHGFSQQINYKQHPTSDHEHVTAGTHESTVCNTSGDLTGSSLDSQHGLSLVPDSVGSMGQEPNLDTSRSQVGGNSSSLTTGEQALGVGARIESEFQSVSAQEREQKMSSYTNEHSSLQKGARPKEKKTACGPLKSDKPGVQYVNPILIHLPTDVEPSVMESYVDKFLRQGIFDIERRFFVEIKFQWEEGICEIHSKGGTYVSDEVTCFFEQMFGNIYYNELDCTGRNDRDVQRLVHKFQEENNDCLCCYSGGTIYLVYDRMVPVDKINPFLKKFPKTPTFEGNTHQWHSGNDQPRKRWECHNDISDKRSHSWVDGSHYSGGESKEEQTPGQAGGSNNKHGSTESIVTRVDVPCNEFLFLTNMRPADYEHFTHGAKVSFVEPRSQSDTLTLQVSGSTHEGAVMVAERISGKLNKMKQSGRVHVASVILDKDLSKEEVESIVDTVRKQFGREVLLTNWYPDGIRLIGNQVVSQAEELFIDTMKNLMEKRSLSHRAEYRSTLPLQARTEFPSSKTPASNDNTDRQVLNVVEEFDTGMLEFLSHCKKSELDEALKDGNVTERHSQDGKTEVSITAKEVVALQTMGRLKALYEATSKGVVKIELDISRSPESGQVHTLLNDCTRKDVHVKVLSPGCILIIGPEIDALQTQLYLTQELNLPRKESSRHRRKNNQDTTPGLKLPTGSYDLTTPEGIHISIYSADITKLKVNAITNAANRFLQHGGGVAGAISRAAGRRFQEDSKLIQQRHGLFKDSDVIPQDAHGGLLLYEIFHVLNAIGPRWDDYRNKNRCFDTLKNTFLNTLLEAVGLEVKSIAIPLISSGLFGVPKEKCAEMLRKAVYEFSSSPPPTSMLQDVHLVNIDHQVTNVIIEEFFRNQPHVKQVATPVSPSCTFTTGEGIEVHVYTSDITKVKVGAIVNAANEDLIHHGGVAWAIAQVAGTDFAAEGRKFVQNNGKLKVSEVFSQNAGGDLRKHCFSVVNAVGPAWDKYEMKEDCLRALKMTFENIFDAVNGNLELKSVAMPLISSGNYGVPAALCAEVLRQAIVEFSKNRTLRILEQIHLVNIDPKITRVIEDEFEMYRRGGAPASEPNTTAHGSKYRHDENYDIIRKGYKKDDSFGDQVPQASARGSDSCSFCRAEPAWQHFRDCSHMFCQSCVITFHKNNQCPECTKIHAASASHIRVRSQPPTQQISGFKPYNPNDYRSSKVKNVSSHHGHNTDSIPLDKHGYLKDNTNSNDVEMRDADNTDGQDDGKHDNADLCAICHDTITNKKILPKCKHEFCMVCIDLWFKIKPTCAVCGQFYGTLTGTQPENGKMTVDYIGTRLPGYGNKHGSIKITYSFPGGIQEDVHPNPGRRYYGVTRTAYLPDTREGKEVLQLLKKAFDARLVFTIGRSVTSGQEGVITWNDIHHKTNTHGGTSGFGYPDPDYLMRVKDELKAKGIV